MPSQHRLGDLQLAIMRVLWLEGSASVSDVHAALADRGLAPTTIATMLTKLEKKGVVRHRKDGRRFVYSPTITEIQVRQSMVSNLVEQLFQGDPNALVTHLVSEHDVSSDELEELRQLLAESEPPKQRKR